MNQRTYRASLILVPVALVAVGLVLAPRLRSAPAPAPAPAAAPAPAVATGSKDAFMRENMVAMDRMMADMHGPSTGDIDRDFTRMMIPHHQGAIDMAEALLRHGKNEELKALARGIIAKQREEIAMMRRIGGEPAPATAPSEHEHEGH